MRRRLPLSALVAGSLAPDFHYLMNMGPRGHFTHSIRGAFVFCLPVALMLLWVFQRVMKLPLISLAPETHQARLVRFSAPFRWGPARRFLAILFALMLGIGLHLAWDAFTHERGFAVRNLPDLRSPPLQDFGSHRPLWSVLQHGSSVLGMVLLAVWYWLWFKRASPEPVPQLLQFKTAWKRWIGAGMVTLAGAIALAKAWVNSGHLASRAFFAGTFVIMFGSLVFIEVFCFSLWWHRRRSTQPSALGDQPAPFTPRQSSPGHPDADLS